MNTKIKNIVICVSMAIILFGLAAMCVFAPKDDFLEAERREPAAFPDFTLENVMKDGVEYNDGFMSKFEKYAVDAFPFRDTFRAIKALFANYVILQRDNNNIYIADGYVSKLDYPLNESVISHNASRFEFIYKNYIEGKTDGKVYLSIIPDKNYFLAEKNGYPAVDFDKLVGDITSETDFAEYIDIFPLLSVEDYYKTDTHWKQECITDVANKLLSSMGAESSSEYRENILDYPFHGVYYGQAALPLPAETIKYLTSDILDGCTVRISGGGGLPVSSVVYNMEKAHGLDPYEMFLSGAVPVVSIENPNAKTDKELIVFRDSFGSSIAPLLAEGYAKVTLVDVRYMPATNVGFALKMFGLDFANADVLFLYSTLVLNSVKLG